MIDLASLAGFAGAYPDKVCLLSHRLGGHPDLSAASLQILACELPANAVVGADDEKLPGAIAVQSLATGAQSAITFRKLENVPRFCAITGGLTSMLGPLLGGLGRSAEFGEVTITGFGPATEEAADPLPTHRLLLQLRGDAHCLVRGEDGEVSLDLTANGGVFLPAGTAFKAKHGAGPTFRLELPWMTPALKDAADARAFRSLLGQRDTVYRPRPWQAGLYRVLRRLRLAPSTDQLR
ncbi:hypothetical protein PB2503_10439 [Parvularcula bermudensis HTCC2503]|uniref:Uncharacterized protein n=1 Tax=Parvularcula bermudensis (strain ATCC BAA-594 / HTCC2503 / KCTC 12087) TaxID=314260 RepID=E0TGK7_PARBH|nr:hypothetical protein [Parvularcula bermudensis]ADM10139.1 hypothetical protein PB2503_10439 [Parvularcula bermudensis HTCC2503]